MNCQLRTHVLFCVTKTQNKAAGDQLIIRFIVKEEQWSEERGRPGTAHASPHPDALCLSVCVLCVCVRAECVL